METTTKTNAKYNTAKGVVRFVLSKCVSGTIITIIHQNTQTFSKSQKVQLYVGAYLVGGLVADQAWERAESAIDDFATSVRNFRAKSTKESKTTV